MRSHRSGSARDSTWGCGRVTGQLRSVLNGVQQELSHLQSQFGELRRRGCVL